MDQLSIQSLQRLQHRESPMQPRVTPAEAQSQFKTLLKEKINEVNQAQLKSGEMTEKLARGETDNLHEVMITGQKASIALQATVEVRNKVIEAYQEVMRMQV
ncbi:flagellar hook-basal body complex protein FliE [Desertibacillus haloalkaliphilus]|nr:flagellar hook-basal body complex protein FliE [Desertibacillus haloalkaliphilus]